MFNADFFEEVWDVDKKISIFRKKPNEIRCSIAFPHENSSLFATCGSKEIEITDFAMSISYQLYHKGRMEQIKFI